ncbi:MAG TPA: terminase small subunit [Pseudolabrys sp.]|nr:terminase small subunit [Pseudolabrys sp.]
MRITVKQQLFVEHYLAHFNATRAAIAAGYSPKTARSIASENLKKPAIASEIIRRAAQITDKLSIEKERILREVSYVAFASLGDVLNPDGSPRPPEEWSEETWRGLGAVQIVRSNEGKNAGQIVTFRVKLGGKDNALRILFEWHERLGRFKPFASSLGTAHSSH